MNYPESVVEVAMLLNIVGEMEDFDLNRSSCNITKWFQSKGFSEPDYQSNVFTNVFKFIGKDKNPSYTGPGIIFYNPPDQEVKAFIGSFRDGKRHGMGYRLAKDKLYIGEYRKDVKHGEGEIWKINEMSKVKAFVGSFVDGVKDGKCYEKKNGHEFTGEMKMGVYHGQCSIKYDNGDFFKGEMQNGVMNGSAKIIYKNGDVYEGLMRNNEMSGDGKYTWSTGKNKKHFSRWS